MERAGIDIITDGEIRRESYSTALSGVNLDNHRCFRVQIPMPRRIDCRERVALMQMII